MYTQKKDIDKPRKRAQNFWKTYMRLTRYVKKDRGKLIALILFSFMAASSLGITLLVTTAGIEILYVSDTLPVVEGVTYTLGEEPPTDFDRLLERYNTSAIEAEDDVESLTGWRPDFESRVNDIIHGMRADISYALRIIAFGIILITLLGGIARYFQQYLAGVISAHVVQDLRMELYSNLLLQSHDFFESRKAGTIMARFSSDVMMVNTGLTSVFVILFREPFKVLSLLGLAFFASPKITLLIVFFISPLILLFMMMAKKLKRHVTSQLNRLATVTSILMETIQGITVVKSFRMENHELDNMKVELRFLRKQMVKISRLNAFVGPATELFLICGAAILIMVGNRIMQMENLAVADLIILACTMIGVVDPMRKVAKINNKIQVSAVSGERVFSYLDAAPSVQESSNPIDLPVIQHEIAFDHVDFSYHEDATVLNDLSFSVKKGEMVALVGFSGAGKSTIAKLLPRFYDPTSGSITIDGVDIREASFESLREQIGYVTQDNVLFNRSVHENISFSRDSITEDQVKAAAHVAHADVFIDPMPDNYQSSISEAGSNLSGGQKQRIAIARAIVKDPAILILDEATSSLDTESETAIQNAIDEFVVGRTTIVIAHRLSTIQRADRIIVLSQGSVAEQGSHHELIEQGGIYSRLHNLQFASMDDPGDDSTRDAESI